MSIRSAVLFGAAVSLAVGLGACGQDGQAGGNASGKGGFAIGLLLPENQTARYEQFDRPLIVKKIKELCRNCAVEYANARDDVATQLQQVDSMITKGVNVLILDAVNIKTLHSSVTKARNADIPVVAYDRSVEGPISAYVSHDFRAVSRLQGQALLPGGRKGDGGQIVRVDGPVTAGPSLFEQGARSVLQGRVKISKLYRAAAWNAGSAYAAMSGAISAVGADNIDGVWASNDVLAGGVIAALRDARITPLPRVVGQDADLAAVQRIVAGEQHMTVYKPFKPEAEAAAELAVVLARGEKPDRITKMKINLPTAKQVPAVLLTPISLTVGNIKDTVVKDGLYTIDQICTPKYRDACEKAGLTTR